MEESSRFIRLNLGCGDRILPGFINIDTLPGVDMQLDVRQGLPFPDASCDTVFSEHFIEHLDRREGLRLLREIRRVLKTGGILRIATPDLEQAVDDYQRNFTHEDFARFGISWARTRCEKLNIGMREWGHKWIYDQEELQRVAEIAGLKFAERCRIGESRHERLQQLEHRAGSRLILEFSKPDRRLAADAAPLVSILILSYKPRYFEKALKSALDQTWKNIEIIVSDDCPDDGIEKIVKKFSSDPRIRYLRNPLPSGGYDNGIHCFEISSGEFIKFLNDDDILMPDCVERLLDGFRKYPDITLAFSKRTLIDANDRILPDQAYTAPLSHEDCVLNGLGLSAGLSVTASNFIGEPSTVLFRKSGLASNKPDFMSLAGHDRIYVLNDHAMWHTLLSAGNAAYVAAPLSCFRIHAEQRQKDAEVPELARASWVKLQEGLYRLGLIGPEPEIVASRILPLGNHPFFMKAEIEKLTALVKCKDCDWPVYDRLGDCAKKMGDVTLAISWYRRAMEKAPAPLRENLKLVKLLMESDCFAEAVEILERYLDRFPDDKKAREWFLTACEARATLQNHERTCPAASLLEYSSWLERRSEGSLLETLHLERIERLWKTRPLFEIALILKPGQEALLADTIDSLAGQGYDGWRLAIFAQSASPEPEFTADSEPVRWIVCSSEDVVDDINACLAASSAHWFGFFDCGTRFSEDAFLMLGDYIAICPQWRVIYTDDDFVAPNGGLHSPRFKPDLNLEFLRSTDYVGGFFIEKQALIEAGGFSMAAGAERYDLLLRAIDALGETSVGHIPEIPVHLPDRLPPCAENEGATSALRRHFDRRKTPVSLLPGLLAGETRRVVYLHEEKPKVSIIVPTRNRLDLLGPCVESLVKKTAWPDWELLIVDNDSDDPAILAYFDKLRELLPERVKIISVPEDFDFSAMNNRAARQARGDYLLLLNNDTECLHGEWLDAMMSYAQRPDVGIVGARLLFPENLQLQHAGMILGADGNGTAGHVFFLQPHDVPGYMNRALLDQEYSAVTGACLLIRASIYHQVAGLDPLFKIQHQDVDLCLKVVELGYRVIWTPFATLIHRSSASLRHSVVDKKVMDSIGEETENFISRWKHRLFRDPAWNRHLGFDFPQYQDRKPTLEMELAVPWNPDFHDRPRVLFLPGRAPVSGDYRGGAALRALNAGGRLHHAAAGRPNADGSRRVIKPVELDRLAPDTLFIHLPVDDASLNALLRYQKHNPEISLICSIDEHPGSPSDEIRLQIALSVSRRLIVGTGPLKEAFREMIGDIRVVPDALERRIWDGLSLEHEQKRKPRVGWTCGQAGAGDSHLMREIVKATHREVDWVFLGALPDELLSELRPCLAERHEFHEYPPDFETWPQKLASLNLDLALAPLEIHPVNEAKSNRRLLEYGMLGWPVVCTDILPYQTGNPPALRLPNDPDKWIAAIRERVGEPDALAREGKALREWVEKNHLLESTLDLWLDALCQTGTNPVMDLRKP